MFDEDKRKHLDYLQTAITRMNTNSFQIRSMVVVVISAMLALFAATPKVIFLMLSIFPSIVFWLLDAYYLQQENKFRAMYDDVAGIANNYAIKLYEMPLKKYNCKECRYWRNFFSMTMLIFYLLLIIIVTIISLIFLFLFCIPLL
jgi:hypothetical protein